jgi:hypothetical protein
MGVGRLLTRADDAFHLLKHRFDVRQAERLFPRALKILEHMQLMGCDRVAFGGVLFCKERAHCFDETAGDIRRESCGDFHAAD